MGRPHLAVFELSEPLAVQPGSHFVILLRQLHGGGHIIGRFSVAHRSDGYSTAATPEDIELILKTESSQRNPEQRLTLNALGVEESGHRDASDLVRTATAVCSRNDGEERTRRDHVFRNRGRFVF